MKSAEILKVKNTFEELSRNNGVVILYGDYDIPEEKDDFMTVELEPDYDWSQLLEKAGKSPNPFLIMNINALDEDDIKLAIPDFSEITKERFGENYFEVQAKIKKFKGMLKEVNPGDISSITLSLVWNRFILTQSFFNAICEVIHFEWSEMEPYAEPEEDNFKVPTQKELKELQDRLKQFLVEEPLFLSCSTKGQRQAMLQQKVMDMDISEYAKHRLYRDSSHIAEIAFVELRTRNKT